LKESRNWEKCSALGFIGFIIFTCVGTYVQRGSKFCFVVVLVLVLLVGKSLVKLASLAVY
jgi:hypothetical protein